MAMPLVGLFTGLSIKTGQAQPSAQVEVLSETNPQAISLGYKMNTASIDRLRWTQFVPGQSCGNCALYQATRGSTQGPCKIFGGQVVMAAGWCRLYKAA